MGCLCPGNAMTDTLAFEDADVLRSRAVKMVALSIILVLIIAGVAVMLFVLFNLIRDSHKKNSSKSWN
jgi:hypothetical protein